MVRDISCVLQMLLFYVLSRRPLSVRSGIQTKRVCRTTEMVKGRDVSQISLEELSHSLVLVGLGGLEMCHVDATLDTSVQLPWNLKSLNKAK